MLTGQDIQLRPTTCAEARAFTGTNSEYIVHNVWQNARRCVSFETFLKLIILYTMVDNDSLCCIRDSDRQVL